ncbi:AzlD domain-containing protein [Ornithinibacillus sp. L9]|uniref:AzlD domain-containing protein n=1 Tax=Ornithinibacillus caprae TaxID=2678566 RepID=A0A6N8FGS4_9BACI|nr:AzlD domain-containing protein [Ornithinibacillus caprae]MUK88770.1 AzlD domain-containing protein [Ornithinibacillus caprae]
MILLIILGMSLVTMIPRILPAFIVDKLQFRDWVNRWLNAIPYAALGALIFPGILSVKEDAPHIGLIGGLVAIGLAYIGLNVILVVIGAIVTVFLLTAVI